ncbi:MAG: tRNA (adenosine(37)-N6)-threonylcarbamoyltransferase complex ATPase subunit type 1 TsaE [Cytophagales bacterium]|nr:tRNA (adenosine(37)-N6)-threonylcarbamoyltransferase complex ATPase subunit type 1 TsaE [Cytophagales bacterium]
MSIHSPIFWHNASATQAFAQAFVAAHDLTNAIIELRGDLGVGKTTLARDLLQALGITGRIKSPTYAIVETYTGQDLQGKDVAISHFDFYRFNDPAEWEEAGFRDIFASKGLKIVEWANKAQPLLPAPDWVISIELLEHDVRCVTVTPSSGGN